MQHGIYLPVGGGKDRIQIELHQSQPVRVFGPIKMFKLILARRNVATMIVGWTWSERLQLPSQSDELDLATFKHIIIRRVRDQDGNQRNGDRDRNHLE